MDEQLARVQRHATRQRDMAWREWVDHAVQGSGGAAHAYARGCTHPSQLQDTGVQDTLQGRVHAWSSIWQRDSAEQVSLLQERLEKMRQALRPSWNDQDEVGMVSCLRRIPTSKRRGLENSCPHLFRRASSEAVPELARPLLRMGSDGIPMAQCLVVLTALLDKASGDGDRPITLLSFLYRNLVRFQSPAIRRWELANSGDWDAATAGRGALEAAYSYEFVFELAHQMGMEAAALLTDLTKI